MATTMFVEALETRAGSRRKGRAWIVVERNRERHIFYNTHTHTQAVLCQSTPYICRYFPKRTIIFIIFTTPDDALKNSFFPIKISKTTTITSRVFILTFPQHARRRRRRRRWRLNSRTSRSPNSRKRSLYSIKMATGPSRRKSSVRCFVVVFASFFPPFPQTLTGEWSTILPPLSNHQSVVFAMVLSLSLSFRRLSREREIASSSKKPSFDRARVAKTNAAECRERERPLVVILVALLALLNDLGDTKIGDENVERVLNTGRTSFFRRSKSRKRTERQKAEHKLKGGRSFVRSHARSLVRVTRTQQQQQEFVIF